MSSKPFMLALVGVGVFVALRVAMSGGGTPAVFQPLTLEEGKQRIAGTEKLLVVKATASWCGPCKMMDRAVFTDKGVEKWIGENGVAIALDVDQARAHAEALGVQTIPTIVVFDGSGREIGRTGGVFEPDAFIGWLGEVRSGGSGR